MKTGSNKSRLLLLFVLILLTLPGFAQKNTESNSESNNQPNVDIKVNREFDKDGNVIRYDSTYSWSWTSGGEQFFPTELFNDSLHSFFFNQNKDFFGETYFDPFGFSTDTIFNNFSSPEIKAMHRQMMEMLENQQKMIEEMFGSPSDISSPENNQRIEEKKPSAKKTAGSIDI